MQLMHGLYGGFKNSSPIGLIFRTFNVLSVPSICTQYQLILRDLILTCIFPYAYTWALWGLKKSSPIGLIFRTFNVVSVPSICTKYQPILRDFILTQKAY